MADETYGVTFDYDHSDTPSCYWIMAVNGPLAYAFDPIRLQVPETAETTQDVQIIVASLRRIAARLEPHPEA